MRSISFLSLFLWLSSAVLAGAEVIDIQQAVDLGLTNSPRVRESTEKVNQLRYEKNVVRGGLFPTIGLNAAATQKKDAVADRSFSSVPFGGSAYNQYTVGFHGEQMLLAYGFFSAGRMASYQEDVAEKQLEIVKRDLTRQVISTFYKTLMNENLVRLLEKQEKSVREILLVAQRRLSLGGKRIDVLQVKTRLALLGPKIVRARNDLAASAAELAHLLGRADTKELRITGQIPSLNLKNVEPHLDFKAAEIPELTSIRLQRKQMTEGKAVALGKNLPNLKLVGDYNFLNYTKDELFDPASNSWSVQLVLSVPLFSGLTSISERNALIAQEAQLEAQERNTKNAVSIEQIRRRNELETAESLLASAEEAVDLAKESLDEARREYRSGLIDFLQYFQLESNNYEATTSLLQLKYDLIGVYSNYFAASGLPISVLIEHLTKQGERI
jgi:outer membrane protein TolC